MQAKREALEAVLKQQAAENKKKEEDEKHAKSAHR
jgi:hypothetical protein